MQTDRLPAGAAPLLPLALETIRAIDGLVAARNERHLRFAPTGRAGRRVHLALAAVGAIAAAVAAAAVAVTTTVAAAVAIAAAVATAATAVALLLARLTAARAPRRLVLEALLRVEFLFAGRKSECH